MASPRVFISMGTPYTSEQKIVRDALKAMLNDRCGVDPRIIGVNESPPGNPLPHIREVMSTCDGVMIVAYERKFVEKGTEKRGGDGERALASERYTTPWNHVESAIAYSLGLPIYVICEKGLREEGLIENKVDWYVQHVEFSPAGLTAPHVVDSIRAWVDNRVKPHARKPKALAAAVTRLKLSEMTFAELKFVLGALIGAFLIGVAAGKFLPWF